MPTPQTSTDKLMVTSLALTQTAVGCGIGLLAAGKLPRSIQRNAAIAMFSVGLMATVPVLVDILSKPWKSERRMRKSLESIRQDSGFTDDVEIF